MNDKVKFPPVGRSIWSNTPETDWQNWHWQLSNSLTEANNFNNLVTLTKNEREAIGKVVSHFSFSITPYYASLIDSTSNSCPIRLQALPSLSELDFSVSDLEDPLAEMRDMPVPGLTHRYPDRVLLHVANICAVYCRFCSRRSRVGRSGGKLYPDMEQVLTYLSQHPEIRDVILSGGDPLLLSNNHLNDILEALATVATVEVIRIGTRCPTTLPQRVTPELAALLGRYHPLYVSTHFNHPRECTAEAMQACSNLINAGCVLNNQTVLLRGVNDDTETLKQLGHHLLEMRVRPYYLYHCDQAKGTSHFRVSIKKGMEILEGMRGWTSGLAIPQYVVDLPEGGGKVVLHTDSVLSRQGDFLFLRNYTGHIYRIHDNGHFGREGETKDFPGTEPSTGRLALLEHNESAVATLKALIAHGRIIQWIGHGLSLALAKALSAICNHYGSPSFASTPDAIVDNSTHYLAWVSRSAQQTDKRVDWLLTQEKSAVGWLNSSTPVFAVSDPDNGGNPWLPLEFSCKAFQAVVGAFGCQWHIMPAPVVLHRGKEVVFAFERHSDVAEACFEAANAKLDGLTLRAIGLSEIGHGLHYRLWNAPHQFVLFGCFATDSTAQKWRHLISWCESVDVPLYWLDAHEPSDLLTEIVQVFTLALSSIEAWASFMGRSLDTNPLPEALDDLRGR